MRVVVVVVGGGAVCLSITVLPAYCIWYFGFINSLRGGILNSIGFYLTLVLRILFGVGSSSFDEVVIHFLKKNKLSPPNFVFHQRRRSLNKVCSCCV